MQISAFSVFVFVIGTIAFMILMLAAKLHTFKGGALKTRVYFALAISLFFTFLLLFRSDGKIHIISKGFLLGIILFIPFWLYTKRWLEKRIEGAVIFYKRKQFRNMLLFLIPVSIIVQISLRTDYGRQIIETTWPFLGLSFSWLFSQVFVLFFIERLERKLGRPIIEDER